MKHIKRLSVFESTQELNQEQIDFLYLYTQGEWGVNPNTGLVDISGDFNCTGSRLNSFKGVKFGVVSENFWCTLNDLTSLEGSPQEVGGGFFCQQNSLTSLKGSPKKVDGIFYCSENLLTSLEGAPRKVGVSFDCSYNSLTSLEGSPQKVGGGFSCRNNSLTSLEGAPEKASWDFNCSNNSLISLEGAPKEAINSFYCYGNPLTSIEGAPQKVGKIFMTDPFKLERGEWNPQGWLKILREGSEEAKSLILTLPFFDPGNLQNEINKNPGKWVMELKRVWNSGEFRPLRDQLKVSDQFLKDIGAQSTLSDLGF